MSKLMSRIIISGRLSATFTRASARIKQAYAMGSRCSYYNKFNTLLAFCIYDNINIVNFNTNNAVSFKKMLASSGLSTATIFTYITAIKAKCSAYGINPSPWSHPKGLSHDKGMLQDHRPSSPT